MSPVFGNFKGMSPLYFITGADEALLSDTTRCAHKARSEGVDVRCEISAFMQHCFVNLGDFPEAINAR